MTAPLVRRPDWPRQLAALFEARRHQPYAYGVNDCAVFMRDAVQAVTGIDVLAGMELPTNWIGAARFLIARGWEDVEEMAAALLGAPLPAPLMAGRGDVVSFRSIDGEPHLAVVAGSVAGTPGVTGIEWVPMQGWRKAWRVG